MSIAVTKYEDDTVVVTRRGKEEDDTVIHMTIEEDDEDWSNSGRIGTIKKTDAGYDVVIEEGDHLSYSYGTWPTMEEAEHHAVFWVGHWPGGWCEANFSQAKV